MSFYDSWNTYTLPSFKCKNITIKNSASERLLCVIINNKLDFTEHLNTACKKTNLKWHALNRISRFLSPEQHVLIIIAYIKSLFNYFPLVWMFCYRGIMDKMNHIPKRSLPLLLKNYKNDFQDLLRSSSAIFIHQRCINSLLIEVYKYIHGLFPEIMNHVFSTRANIYNTRQFNVFWNLEQIWIEFYTLQSQPTLELTSWKPQIISVINSI